MRNRKKTLKRWQDRPDLFFKECLGIKTLEDYQVELLRDIAKHDKIAIRATHSVGKTWTLARVALWFYTCFKNSIIITTAPTSRQVDALLWGELRDAYRKSKIPLGGRLLNLSLKRNDKHYAIGFTTSKKAGETKEQMSSSFQGFHSDHVMIIFDEAVGIEADTWVMAQGLMTSGITVKFVGIANPTTRNCEFHNCFSDISFKKIHLSCFDSPNMKANGFIDMESLEDELDYLSTLNDDKKLSVMANYKKPVPHLLTAQWVIPNLLKWGLKHPLSLSKIFGEFPTQDDTVLIQYEYLNDAVAREMEYDDSDKRYIGVDVARFGIDKTVFTEIIGKVHVGTDVHVKRDTAHISGILINKIKESSRVTVVTIDATGIGAGVVDNLVSAVNTKILGKNVQIVEIHFGQSPVDKELEKKDPKSREDKEKIKQDKERYVNLKAKMFDLLSDDLKNNITLLEESVYFETLPMIKVKYDGKGRMQVESKEDYKKRTGKDSPDEADSLALCNYARHLEIGHGVFKGIPKSEAMVKQRTRKGVTGRIKVTEY